MPSVNVGLVGETDLAFAITAREPDAVGLVTETDLAQSVGKQKRRAVGQATHTNTALALVQTRVDVGQAAETDETRRIRGDLGVNQPAAGISVAFGQNALALDQTWTTVG